MKYSSVLLSAIFLFITVQACGNVSADSIPQMLPNEVITGITVTSADNMILGEIGDPSHGGDAEGKQITCTNGTGIIADPDQPVSIPSEFRMHTPYPNPTDESFNVSFAIPCQMDLSLYLVDPDPERWGPVSGLMHSSVPTRSGEVVWEQKSEGIDAGIHSVQIPITYDSGINRFFRLYLKADGILAWRDVAIFTDICKAPPGWTIAGQRCN